MTYRWLAAMLALASAGCGPVLGGWMTNLYGAHEFVALSETQSVRESSGVVASRANAHLYWTHNDSGSPAPRLYAFRLNDTDRAAQRAKDLGYLELQGASNLDWEDIALGPGNKLYVFDGGDNPPCERANKRIHRCDEPAVDPDGAPIGVVGGFESIRVEYPAAGDASQAATTDDDRYDAECLMVHPATGDLYVITKRNHGNIPMAKVFKLPASAIAWNSERVHVLQYLTNISSRVPHMATAGDIHVDGRHLVVRNYWSAYEFVNPADQPFDKIFDRHPHEYPLLLEVAQLLQGEGICYGVFSGDLITTIEARGASQFSIFAVSWQLANTRVEPAGDGVAVVRWDTRKPADSRVDYGTSAWYGKSRMAEGQVTAHSVKLEGLTAGQRYCYRVRSGPLVYPAKKDANLVQFVSGKRRPVSALELESLNFASWAVQP